jgi:hypothetical protein
MFSAISGVSQGILKVEILSLAQARGSLSFWLPVPEESKAGITCHNCRIEMKRARFYGRNKIQRYEYQQCGKRLSEPQKIPFGADRCRQRSADAAVLAERRTKLQKIFQNKAADEVGSSPSTAGEAGTHGSPNQVTNSMKPADTSDTTMLSLRSARVMRFLSSHSSKQRNRKTMTKAKKKRFRGRM